MRSHEFLTHMPSRNTPSIYGLKDPRDGLFRYVGQAVDPVTRFKQHTDLRTMDGNPWKARWLEELSGLGIRPELVVLEECGSFPDADKAEREWIRRLIEEDHPILNIAIGGAGTRSASKLRSARKRDWIELGYKVKCARDATLSSMCDLSGMLPKNAKEVQLFKKALKALDAAKNQLDERLCAEYPKWTDFIRVFYGLPEEHFAELKTPLTETEFEARREAMTLADLRRVMDEIPTLTAHGIGVYNERAKTPEQRTTELADGRRELLQRLEECKKVCGWLAEVESVGSINERIGTSYGLKHVAEDEVGYVCNGAFIAAAVFCGFRYRVEPGSPNVLFNMSGKSIKAIRQRIEARKVAAQSA